MRAVRKQASIGPIILEVGSCAIVAHLVAVRGGDRMSIALVLWGCQLKRRFHGFVKVVTPLYSMH